MFSSIVIALILSVFLFTGAHGKGTLTLPFHVHQHRSQLRLLPRGRAENDHSNGVTPSLPLYTGGTNVDETFQFNVAIGTPAQSMNLTIDVTHSRTIVFGAGERERNCYKVASTRNYFDPNASKTLDYDLSPFPYTFAGPYTECGNDISDGATEFADTIIIGNFIVEYFHPIIFTPKCSKYLNPAWPSDGVFGLGHNDGNMFIFLRNFDQYQIALYHKRGQITSVSEPAGTITIGGPDLQNCDSSWTYALNYDDFSWGFPTGLFFFGSATYNERYYAFLLSNTSYIWTPSKYFQKIVSVIGAEYDYQRDQYVVDCANIPTFPDMVFQIWTLWGPYEYRLPAADYVRKIDPTMTKCTLMLKEQDPASIEYPCWYLGTTFNRGQCIMFDYYRKLVMFAKAKQ